MRVLEVAFAKKKILMAEIISVDDQLSLKCEGKSRAQLAWAIMTVPVLCPECAPRIDHLSLSDGTNGALLWREEKCWKKYLKNAHKYH